MDENIKLIKAIEEFCARQTKGPHWNSLECKNCLLSAVCDPAMWPTDPIPEDIWESIERFKQEHNIEDD